MVKKFVLSNSYVLFILTYNIAVVLKRFEVLQIPVNILVFLYMLEYTIIVISDTLTHVKYARILPKNTFNY